MRGEGHFPDGVYFVNLAPIRDANLVVSAIAQTLGLTESGDQPLVNRLHAYLRDKRLLLLLDNFEQIVDAAPLIAELLAECPHVKVLVTSRVPLHLRGEQEYAVPSLALPPNLPLSRGWERGPGGEGDLTQYAAVQLFIQRALDVQPAFAVTNANAPAVAEICARLDGLPLAIELAAARIKLFAPEALLARLSNRLALLTGGARDLPQRQQTLRNAITWSYDLLDEGAQTLFQRLAVFVGGWTPEAAEAVCDELNIENEKLINDQHIFILNSQFSILDGLATLVDNSLLQRAEGAQGEPRFVMFETIREYALEQLAASGELEAIQWRHAEYFLTLAEAAEQQLRGPEQHMWLERLEAEHDNLRSALAWALEGGNTEVGLRLAVALWQFWEHGYWSEGWAWLGRAAVGSSGVATALRAKVLLRAGWFGGGEQATTWVEESLVLFRELGDRGNMTWAIMKMGYHAWRQNDYARAIALLGQSLALFRELGDKRGIASTLHHLGDATRDQGDSTRAIAFLEESVTFFKELGDKVANAFALLGLGDAVYNQRDDARAWALYQESATLFQEAGDRYNIPWALRNLGRVAHAQGDNVQARVLLEETVARFREVGNQTGLAWSIHHLGDVMHVQGDDTQAQALLREALILQQKEKNKHLIAESLECWAGLAVKRQPARAARLLGAAVALRAALGAPLPPGECADYDRDVASAHAQLDEATFAAAWAAGRAMTLEQAIAEALNR